MLLRQSTLDGIQNGSITLAFRRWKRPTVKTGGTLLTSAGQLAIVAVTEVALEEITEEESRRAGYPDLAALFAELESRPDGGFYRIQLGAISADPRIALRAQGLTPAGAADIQSKLNHMDQRSAEGPWTLATLRMIAQHPGTRALDLAGMVGREKAPFKIDVRKLKKLGLTESLEMGYRISPRGQQLLDHLEHPLLRTEMRELVIANSSRWTTSPGAGGATEDTKADLPMAGGCSLLAR